MRLHAAFGHCAKLREVFWYLNWQTNYNWHAWIPFECSIHAAIQSNLVNTIICPRVPALIPCHPWIEWRIRQPSHSLKASLHSTGSLKAQFFLWELGKSLRLCTMPKSHVWLVHNLSINTSRQWSQWLHYVQYVSKVSDLLGKKTPSDQFKVNICALKN
jgi:hypothetical protein